MYLYRLGDLEDRGGTLRAPIPVCVGGDDIELTDRFQCQRGREGIVHHPKILEPNDARRPLQIFNPNV